MDEGNYDVSTMWTQEFKTYPQYEITIRAVRHLKDLFLIVAVNSFICFAVQLGSKL